MDELHRRIQELEHKNALQEKDIQIKELELQVSRQNEESTRKESLPTLTGYPDPWMERDPFEEGVRNLSSMMTSKTS